MAGSFDLPIGSQDPEQRGRQHHIALLAAFAIGHMNGHAGAVDVLNPQPYHLTGSNARGVGGGERDTIPPDRDRLQERSDLLPA